jgi:hypothetical protein
MSIQHEIFIFERDIPAADCNNTAPPKQAAPASNNFKTKAPKHEHLP